MRRLLVILGLAGALIAPLSSEAGTTVSRDTLDFTGTICNGDVVHVTGTQVVVLSDTLTNVRSQDLTGVDLTTGTVYHGANSFFDQPITTPSGTSVETFSQDLRLAAPGGESFTATGLFHATATPDGTLRVFLVKESVPC
jgi:hypothetical protein